MGIVLVLTTLVILFVPLPVGAVSSDEHTIRVEASRFQFTPSTLNVNPGDRVTLELVASDVVHGLSIDGYELEMVAEPGQTARATFVANRSGSFRFRCTVTCGNMHPFMVGKLRVGSNTFYWRAAALMALAVFAGWWRVRR